jgi:predicted nucleic acid-binding protein
MRRFLLDTTPMAAYLHERRAAMSLIRPWVENHEVVTSILAYGEIVEYIKGFADFERRHGQLRRLLLEIYPFFLTFPILERYADIRRQLRPPHGPGLIGDIDTLIAATAIQHGLTLVTVDTDFERIPGLDLMLVSVRG